MRIEIDAGALETALSWLSRVVERRSAVPILSAVQMAATAEGLAFTATDMDMEVTIRRAAALTDGAPASACLVLAPLLRLIRAAREGVEGETVELNCDDDGAGDPVALRLGEVDARVAAYPVADFPSFQAAPAVADIEIGAGVLADLFGRVAPCVSTEDVRYYLNGVYLHLRDGRLAACATDGYRLALATVDIMVPTFPGQIVPRKAVQVLVAALRQQAPEMIVRLRVSERGIEVAWPEAQMLIRAIDGTFPDYDRVIPAADAGKPIEVDRARLLRALRVIAALAANRRRGSVKAEIDGARLTLSSEDFEGSRVATALPAGYAGVALTFGANVDYFRELVQGLRAPTVTLRLEGQYSPIRVEASGDAGVMFLLMPMRV